VKRKNFFSNLGSSVFQLDDIKVNQICVIVAVLYFFAVNLFVTPMYKILYQNQILVYLVLLAIFARNSDISFKAIKRQLPSALLWGGLSFLGLRMLNLSVFSSQEQFTGFTGAFLYYIFVVGAIETLVFTVHLPEKVGVFWACVIAALAHIGTMYALLGVFSLASLGYVFLLFLALRWFYERTNNPLAVAFIHGVFDLIKYGWFL